MAPDLQSAEPFAAGEKRGLAIRPEAIAPVYVVGGKPPTVEARLVEIDTSPARRGPRGYLLTDLPRRGGPEGRLRVKLWNADPADDQRRLTEIVESHLTKDSPPPDELAPLHR